MNRDRPKAYLGIGAFNLVRAAAYRQCGGYEALRLTVVDDMKLGLLLRRAGKRTRAFLGVDDVECHWGTTVGSMVKIMEKNYFAAIEFRLGLVVAGSVFAMLVFCILIVGLMTGTPAGLAAGLSPLSLIAARRNSGAAAGLVLALRILAAVHVSRLPVCIAQLDFRDAASGRHPLARHILSAGHLAGGERAIRPVSSEKVAECRRAPILSRQNSRCPTKMKFLFLLITAFLISGQVLRGADETGSASDGNVSHGYATNNSVRIHYASVGHGPLVVLIHGFPDFWFTWRHQMQALSNQYQLVAIDLRGYNLSDKPKGAESYDMSLLLEDVSAVLRHFGNDKAIIVGHDWGGAIAWMFAMTRPEATKS